MYPWGQTLTTRFTSLSKAMGRSLWVNPTDAKSTRVQAVNPQSHGRGSTVNFQPKDLSGAGGPAPCEEPRAGAAQLPGAGLTFCGTCPAGTR